MTAAEARFLEALDAKVKDRGELQNCGRGESGQNRNSVMTTHLCHDGGRLYGGYVADEA